MCQIQKIQVLISKIKNSKKNRGQNMYSGQISVFKIYLKLTLDGKMGFRNQAQNIPVPSCQNYDCALSELCEMWSDQFRRSRTLPSSKKSDKNPPQARPWNANQTNGFRSRSGEQVQRWGQRRNEWILHSAKMQFLGVGWSWNQINIGTPRDHGTWSANTMKTLSDGALSRIIDQQLRHTVR